jgi:hypothetical protein
VWRSSTLPPRSNGSTVLDSVGFTSTPAGVFKEGTGLPTLSATAINYAFYRDTCGKGGSPTTGGGCPTGGLPADTNNNAADFIFVDTQGTSTPAGQRIGAPGPENLSSPIQRNSAFGLTLLDPGVSSSVSPNRVRDFTSDPGNNSMFGTLLIRRTVTNKHWNFSYATAIRVVDLTVFPRAGRLRRFARAIIQWSGRSVDHRFKPGLPANSLHGAGDYVGDSTHAELGRRSKIRRFQPARLRSVQHWLREPQ